MADPFVGPWEVTFGELTGGTTPSPDPFPFGVSAILDIAGGPVAYDFTIKTPNGDFTFPALTKPGTPPQISAEGQVDGHDPGGIYNFLGYLTTDFISMQKVLVGVFTWNELGTPTDDPPATGGWVGGPESAVSGG